jgi:hypothetical protein
MKDSDIDTYIATFKKLLKLAGYKEEEYGALNMFKQGLPLALNAHIIQNTMDTLKDLPSWIEATRNQQLKYLEGQEFSKKGLSAKQQYLAHRLGINPNNWNQQRHDPNAMDVDARNISHQNQPHCTQLTNQEKNDLYAKGACFKCCMQGHISKYFPMRQQNGTADVGRLAPTPQVHTTAPEPAEEKMTMDKMVAIAKGFMVNQESKQEFFDKMVESGFV